MLLSQGPEAALAANDPRLIKAMTEYAIKGGDPLVGAVGDLVKASGIGGLHPTLTGDNLAQTIWRNETRAVSRAGGRARFNIVGGIDRVTGAVANPFRNLANGMEWAHRTGLWAHMFRSNIINAKATFAQEMSQLGERYGMSVDDLRGVMETHAPVVDGAEVADSFGRLAQSRGIAADEAKGFATEMGRRWQSRIYKADEAARATVNKSLFSYEQTNLDHFVRRVVPFHFWMTRAYPFYAEQALRHPGFAASYYRLYQATDEQAESENWPETLQTFKRLWSGPGGMMLLVNPIAALGGFDMAFELSGGYTDENLSGVGKVLTGITERTGMSLLPIWSGLLNYGGYLGDSPQGLDPIGLQQARRFLGGLVQLGASEGWLQPAGIPAGTLLDRPYEEIAQKLRGRPLRHHRRQQLHPAGRPQRHGAPRHPQHPAA